MIRLSLEHINAKSPYEVREAGGGYEFRTEGAKPSFIRWFEKAANPNRFTIRTTHANVEGQELYIAIIVENRNSRLKAITDEFDSTAAALTDKP